ncbi:MAG: N-6 DNA methylase [Bacteroidota bacterium]|nr:N-6 DNA methylase [Bacteroidota bacterium]
MEKVELSDVFNLLDFDTESKDSTLFLTSKDYSTDVLFFEERLVLEDAKKLDATAVFFRRFAEKQSSIPQLFIFDNTTHRFSEEDLAIIHRRIWSSSIVPMYYVFDNSNINVYDARKAVSYNKNNKQISISAIENLPLISSSLARLKYSAKRFLNGTFWEQKELANNFLSKESAQNKLIEGLKKIRSQFIEESNLESNLAHQILVLSILVKYLEERKDEQGNHVFPSDYFRKYNNSNSFCEVIRSGNIVGLFEDLSLHFNGKIFELSPDDKAILSDRNLTKLAEYLDANSENDQFVLWPLYSFEYLPVELISRIYEEFIPERNDAVYTPIHLARLMVDECMPISDPKSDYKVIDVSCGSGVFLVTVFKRLVQWWQKEQYDQFGQIKHPTVEILKKILLNSVYGVDIESDSVRLSVFSLSIALCDMLKPTEIWTELRFEDLKEKNIYTGNFFKYLNEKEKGQFDLVIGNPPFEDKMKDFDSLYTEFNIEKDYHIPRNQIAMLFLQQAMKMLSHNGLLCFVMPSGPLLYNNTIDFRKKFFSTYEIPQIIDFSELREKSLLFEKTIATAVVFAYNRKPERRHNILHITVKRAKSAKEKLFFEIDHYDMHNVPQEIAETDLNIWKSNLLGGNQLYYLVSRLSQLRNLGDYLEEKKKTCGWVYGEGYVTSKRLKPASHLTGRMMVEAKHFTEAGIVKTGVETETLFYRTSEKNKDIFLAPHLLLKESLGNKNFIIQYLDFDIIFKHRIIGIHTSRGQESELENIKILLKNNYHLFKLLILATSAEAGINRSGGYIVLKKDFMNLPFPEHENILQLSKNEEIIKSDVLNYKLEELSKGENAKINTATVSDKQLEEFGEVFCENLNSIYQVDGRSFMPLNPIHTISYTCYPFAYGNDQFVPEISSKIKEGDLSELIDNKQDSVHYHRILRLYQKDLVFLVKPNTLRFWLKSIALRDVSDVMIDLVKSGY